MSFPTDYLLGQRTGSAAGAAEVRDPFVRTESMAAARLAVPLVPPVRTQQRMAPRMGRRSDVTTATEILLHTMEAKSIHGTHSAHALDAAVATDAVPDAFNAVAPMAPVSTDADPATVSAKILRHAVHACSTRRCALVALRAAAIVFAGAQGALLAPVPSLDSVGTGWKAAAPVESPTVGARAHTPRVRTELRETALSTSRFRVSVCTHHRHE